MKLDDFEVGKCYTVGDDGLYKVIEKGKNWMCVLSYSYNHRVCLPILVGDEWCEGDWREESDMWCSGIFNELELIGDNDYLKYNG